jgi:hypothetical protein
MSAGPLQPGPWLDDGVVVADTGNVISSLPLHGRDPPGGSHGKLPRPTKVLSPLSSPRSYCDWRGRSSGRRREAVPAVSGATCFWICTCERTPSFRQKEKHYAVTGQPRVTFLRASLRNPPLDRFKTAAFLALLSVAKTADLGVVVRASRRAKDYRSKYRSVFDA